MTEQRFDIHPKDILVKPTLPLFEELKPGFNEVVRNLDQECLEGKGHGFFWRLYLDKFNLVETLSLDEAATAELKNVRHQLTNGLRNNVKTMLDDIERAINLTKNDSRFNFDLGTNHWENFGIECNFEFLKTVKEDWGLIAGANVYDILYGIFDPETNSVKPPSSFSQ